MEATNNELKFLKGERIEKKLSFSGDSVQTKPKQVKDRYEFPDEEIFAKAQKMAVELKKKYPKMKPARIARKVAEYYHLKQKI